MNFSLDGSQSETARAPKCVRAAVLDSASWRQDTAVDLVRRGSESSARGFLNLRWSVWPPSSISIHPRSIGGREATGLHHSSTRLLLRKSRDRREPTSRSRICTRPTSFACAAGCARRCRPCLIDLALMPTSLQRFPRGLRIVRDVLEDHFPRGLRLEMFQDEPLIETESELEIHRSAVTSAGDESAFGEPGERRSADPWDVKSTIHHRQCGHSDLLDRGRANHELAGR